MKIQIMVQCVPRMPFSLTTIKTFDFQQFSYNMSKHAFFEFILLNFLSLILYILPFTQFGFSCSSWSQFLSSQQKGLLFTCQTSLYRPPGT